MNFVTRKLATMVNEFTDGAKLGAALGEKIADLIEDAARANRAFLLGCPGGRTPNSTYAALAKEIERRDLDLSTVVIAMMDDYVEQDGDSWRHIDEHAHNSCRRFAREEIQGVLNRGVSAGKHLPDANVWFPDPRDPESYDERLRAAGGIDFFLLASGAGDGHVAFNPPGSSINSRSRIVQLAEQTRRDNLATFPDFAGIDEVPTHGVTVGIATIAEFSKRAAMILLGSDKQRAYSELTAVATYNPSWPASVVHLIQGAQLWVDESAGGARS